MRKRRWEVGRPGGGEAEGSRPKGKGIELKMIRKLEGERKNN
jgi:hypothetical protein